MHIIHSYIVKPFNRAIRSDWANPMLYREWRTWEQRGQGTGEERGIAVKRLIECLRTDAEELDLTSLSLTSLPEKLPPNITSLQISYNQLTQLPQNLPLKIDELDASNNSLSSLPKKLPPQLALLNISYNSLTSLPKDLTPSLKVLDVSNNQLTRLPETLPPELCSLIASENRLTNLPKKLPPALRSLIVNDNQLKQLPASLPSTLTKLSANQNSLTSLPTTLPSTLYTLSVSCNRLTHLPETLPPRLEALEVSANPLTQLPENLPPSLYRLNVGGTQLCQLPQKWPPKLDSLDIGDTLLTELPENLPQQLTSLDISCNPRATLPKNWPPNLTYLGASEMALTTLPENLPQSLNELLVQYNQLTHLPERLPLALATLSVNNNQLTCLSENLPPLLLQLNAGHNRIRHLPVNLPPSLLLLDVSHNQLTRLSAGLETLPRQTCLDVRDNFFSLEELYRLTQIHNAKDYRGPRIVFSMTTTLPEYPIRTLRECVSTWGPQAVERWDVIEAEPGARAFALFLDRLSRTVNYGNPDFKQAISAWLVQLAGEDRQALRILTFQIAEEAALSCEDRVSLAYNEMKMLMLSNEVETGRYDEHLAELIERAKGLFRLESLNIIAREKARSLNFVDEIEVYLAYQIKLRDALSLPLDTQDMRFFEVSWVTEADLASAKEQVKRHEEKDFFHYLSTEWQPWQAVLERLEPTHYQEARDKLQAAMGDEFHRTLEARLNAVYLADDDDASRQYGIEIKRNLERDIMGQLTTAFLKRRGLSLA
ncbi:NEL-type E3 ubiquitin ligase domain-containing protein [Sodalis endosymbiont of Spalangia cameroni]|uniref:NEL-type E3 ubiquitin ligase domain-containing protein n=1 Tax=Sodalis praecaptivus TaxID=1239307 RepID=UPI0031F84581